MKTVKKMAAQGDVMFIKIDKIPDDAIPQEIKEDRIVVAHSETGHDHVIESRNSQYLIDKTNDFIAYMKTTKPVEVKHLRSFDTHESIELPAGNYEIRRQREYIPQGFRRVAD